MVALIVDRYNTTIEHANFIVGTISDDRQGYAAGAINQLGSRRDNAYVTCQLAVTKELRRTGKPFKA